MAPHSPAIPASSDSNAALMRRTRWTLATHASAAGCSSSLGGACPRPYSWGTMRSAGAMTPNTASRWALLGVVLLAVTALAACNSDGGSGSDSGPTAPLDTNQADTPTTLESSDQPLTHSDSASSQDGLAALPLLPRMQSVLVLVETPQGVGTGLIVEGGYIVTSYRLVATYEAAQVTSSAHDLQGRTVPLVAWEPRTDLAVLGPVDVELEALPIAESAATPVGTIIFLAAYEEAEIGVPTLTIVPGRLTSVHTPDPAGPTYVLTNAYIEAGRSSGVIIDSNGTLIGIATVVVDDPHGTLGIPAEDAVRIASQRGPVSAPATVLPSMPGSSGRSMGSRSRTRRSLASGAARSWCPGRRSGPQRRACPRASPTGSGFGDPRTA